MDPGAELLKRFERAHLLCRGLNESRNLGRRPTRIRSRKRKLSQGETIDLRFSGAHAGLGKLFVTLEEPNPAIFELERAIELNHVSAQLRPVVTSLCAFDFCVPENEHGDG
jgi:hypothetical protein